MVIGIARKEGGVGIGDGAGNGKLGGRRGGVKKEGKERGERIFFFSPGSFFPGFLFWRALELNKRGGQEWGGQLLVMGMAFWGCRRERERERESACSFGFLEED